MVDDSEILIDIAKRVEVQNGGLEKLVNKFSKKSQYKSRDL